MVLAGCQLITASVKGQKQQALAIDDMPHRILNQTDVVVLTADQ